MGLLILRFYVIPYLQTDETMLMNRENQQSSSLEPIFEVCLDTPKMYLHALRSQILKKKSIKIFFLKKNMPNS